MVDHFIDSVDRAKSREKINPELWFQREITINYGFKEKLL